MHPNQASVFDFQPSPMSSLDSFFHSSSEDSHRTTSTGLSTNHRNKCNEGLKDAPVKPKRVPKGGQPKRI